MLYIFRKIIGFIGLLSLILLYTCAWGVEIRIECTPTENEQDSKIVNFYRMYNPDTGEHLWTINYQEVLYLFSEGWYREGVAALVRDSMYSIAVPFYRLWDHWAQHMWTTDISERDALIRQGWQDEGIAAWVGPNRKYKNGNIVPFYRLYNSNTGQHMWTTDISERDALIREGWHDEGIACYVGYVQ